MWHAPYPTAVGGVCPPHKRGPRAVAGLLVCHAAGLALARAYATFVMMHWPNVSRSAFARCRTMPWPYWAILPEISTSVSTVKRTPSSRGARFIDITAFMPDSTFTSRPVTWAELEYDALSMERMVI